MPDDLVHRLESLQRSFETLPADLGKKLDKLDKQLGQADQQLSGLYKSAEEAARARKEIQRRLEELDQQVAAYIKEDRAARTMQYALTALVGARADHDRQFGHHQLVRRTAIGMLEAMTTGTVRPAALLGAAEQVIVGASGYWLSPALVAVAAWAGDSPESAEHAVLEAVSRDPGRSALFFSLVLARLGRPDAASRWIAEYARAQDCNALTGEFTAVLDAVARGALGGRARERLLDVCRCWRDQIGQFGAREAKQVASWTEFIHRQRRPLTDMFGSLGAVSRDWGAMLGRLEAATAFGHTEQWLIGRLGSTDKGGEMLQDVADGLLRELIDAPDQAERVLIETARQWQAVVEHGSHPPTPSSGDPGEPARTDFLTLATAIATGARQSELSEQAVRFCLILSETSVERAVTDLSQQVRSTYPASIEVDIEGWHHAMEPGDDPEALVRKFLDWAADEQMAGAKEQSTRRWLTIGRSSARLEQIESSWEERKRTGSEAAYLAAIQVNLFFQKWQQGITAAGQCVGLLRAQPAGAWSDTQESGAVPGWPRPSIKLPDWDFHPPDTG